MGLEKKFPNMLNIEKSGPFPAIPIAPFKFTNLPNPITFKITIQMIIGH
jgi:hypothetical protein